MPSKRQRDKIVAKLTADAAAQGSAPSAQVVVSVRLVRPAAGTWAWSVKSTSGIDLGAGRARSRGAAVARALEIAGPCLGGRP